MKQATAIVTLVMATAIVTVLVTPKRGTAAFAVPVIITELGGYTMGAIRSMLGTEGKKLVIRPGSATPPNRNRNRRDPL